VVYGLVQWATTTWSSQGRLVFTAISPLAVLLALGLAGWLPPRPARATLAGVGGFMLAIAAAAPFLWIRPAYIPAVPGEPLTIRSDAIFGDQMRLAGYELLTPAAQPGDSVWVSLEWEALQPMARDWSVFLHANDPVLERPIAQRDMFPAQGLRPTRLLQPGDRTVDHLRLTIPETAVAPATLDIVAGLYDFATNERLATTGGDSVILGTVELQPRDGDFPNPVDLAFEHGLNLVGFAVEPRRTSAGGTIWATTYWQPTEPLPEDYTFFGQIVGPDTTRYAAADPSPAAPTTQWQVGDTYAVTMELAVDPATPPDTYPLIVGLYSRTADGGFNRLQQVTPDGRLTDDFLVLTLIRID
jgi:hypothetical protein